MTMSVSNDSNTNTPTLRLVFWETTARCNLTCKHCRRLDALGTQGTDLYDTTRAKDFVDQVAECGRPLLILSGGEPLLRKDIFEIATHAVSRGLIVSLATNGTLIDDEKADRIKASGIRRVAISVDGGDPATHDAFRGLPGSFEGALAGLRRVRERGVETQLNCSVSNHNVHQRQQVFDLALAEKVSALHFFVLVPVGCGLEIAESHRLGSAQVEEFLTWLVDQTVSSPVHLKATCAPQFFRIRAKKGVKRQAPPHAAAGHPGGHPGGLPGARLMEAETRGCLAGQAVCFVSHEGDVFPCGYLPMRAGSIREKRLKEIWETSTAFKEFRGMEQLAGKCGFCEYRSACAGCRARALGHTGNVWEADPYCAYQPEKKQ
jgi:radical SAM protein with 4Fe4S-binding SPASM domain